MNRRLFIRNLAASAIVGGIASPHLRAASSDTTAAAKKAHPALCLVYGQLNQTGQRITEELTVLQRLGIPADIAVSLEYRPETMAALNAWSERGNLVSLNLYPYLIDPACPDHNWHAYDEEIGRAHV